MSEEPRKKWQQPLGFNQLKILAALMEGPLDGIEEGKLAKKSRCVVNALKRDYPLLPKPKQRRVYLRPGDATAWRQKAVSALAGLIKSGYVRKERVRVNAKGQRDELGHMLRSVYTITHAGMEAFGRQKDPLYRKALREKRWQESRKRQATYLTWRQSMDPTYGFPRWLAKRIDWRALVECHPVDGWRFQIIKPDNSQSDWIISEKQEKNPTFRIAEATLRYLIINESPVEGRSAYRMDEK